LLHCCDCVTDGISWMPMSMYTQQYNNILLGLEWAKVSGLDLTRTTVAHRPWPNQLAALPQCLLLH
jgi:hypothetical protein